MTTTMMIEIHTPSGVNVIWQQLALGCSVSDDNDDGDAAADGDAVNQHFSGRVIIPLSIPCIFDVQTSTCW